MVAQGDWGGGYCKIKGLRGKDMDKFSVHVQVGDVQGGKWLDVEALVDTGATHIVIPEETATALGIEEPGVGTLSTSR